MSKKLQKLKISSSFQRCTVPELKRQSVLHRLITHVSSGHIFISCQDTALMAPSNTKKLLFFLYLQVCGNLNRVSQIPSVCLGCWAKTEEFIENITIYVQYNFNWFIWEISDCKYSLVSDTFHSHSYTETIVWHLFEFLLYFPWIFLSIKWINLCTTHSLKMEKYKQERYKNTQNAFHQNK